MNRALLSVLALTLAWAGGDEPTSISLRVLTYNIHHGEGTDGLFDLPRVAAVIRSVEPDLVALQELDQGTERVAGVNQLDELGRLTAMYAEFGKAMDFKGGSYGVGILSRVRPLAATVQALPSAPDREPRTSLTVEVPFGRSTVLFTTTHLDQGREEENRMAQATYLNQLLARRDDEPAILAGDLNSRPGSEVMQVLDTLWTDASATVLPPPETSRGPRAGLDHILVRPADRWRVVEAQLVDAPLVSDHRPVLVVLER